MGCLGERKFPLCIERTHHGNVLASFFMHPPSVTHQTTYGIAFENHIISAVDTLILFMTVAFIIFIFKIIMGIHVTPHRMLGN
jgi:hypothetical protein